MLSSLVYPLVPFLVLLGQAHPTASGPLKGGRHSTWGLALPCCVRGDPDVVEATRFGQMPFIILCLPCGLEAGLLHG